MRTALAAELAVIAAMPDDVVRAELIRSYDESWGPSDLSWCAGDHLGARVAASLHRVWEACVRSDWPRRRTLLERDVMYRAERLAVDGWPGALDQMSRRSAWVGDDAVRFGDTPAPDRVVGDDGMQFVPVCVASGSWLCQAPSDRHALIYRARGRAAPVDGEADDGVRRLLGGNRSEILARLEQPATTSELSVLLGLALGTVGGHLSVLREAGLVRATRVGRRAVYRRTEIADRLLDSGRT